MTATTAVVIARMGSSRFPGKVLRPILGRPMLERMVERIRLARSVEQVVLATTDQAEDDALAALAERMDIGCFRGSAEDVLGRLAAAARAVGADPIVELLGDNPLVHGALIDAVVALFRHGRFEYAATVTREYPHAPAALKRFAVGVRVQVMSAEALARCERLAVDPVAREHASHFIAHHPALFRIGYFEATGPWAPVHRPQLTFAVNHAREFEFICQLFERCAPTYTRCSIQEAMHVLDDSPDLRRLMEPSHAAAAM